MCSETIVSIRELLELTGTVPTFFFSCWQLYYKKDPKERRTKPICYSGICKCELWSYYLPELDVWREELTSCMCFAQRKMARPDWGARQWQKWWFYSNSFLERKKHIFFKTSHSSWGKVLCINSSFLVPPFIITHRHVAVKIIGHFFFLLEVPNFSPLAVSEAKGKWLVYYMSLYMRWLKNNK